jgi:transposase
MEVVMEVIIKFLEGYFTKTRVCILIALIMMELGFSNSQIKTKLGLSLPSLRKHRAFLDNGDVKPLFVNGGKRRKSELDEHFNNIAEDFEKKEPSSLREANERIFKLTGKKLSLNRLRIFLKKRDSKTLR